MNVIEAALDAEKDVKKFRQYMLIAILIMVILSGAAYAVWHHGYKFADSKWVTAHNKEVGELNKKIKGIEDSSKTEAENLRKQVTELQAKLEKIKTAAPIIVTHDVKGEVLKCEGKEVVPYMGSEFSTVWNRLNEEGAMK